MTTVACHARPNRKNILVLPVDSLSPTIEETISCLAKQDRDPVHLSSIHIPTTAAAKGALEASLVSDGALERLADSLGCPIPKCHIHVFESESGTPLRDIRSEAESHAFALGISELLRRLTMDPNCRVIGSISGGCRNMGMLLTQSMQLFAREYDELTDLVVSGATTDDTDPQFAEDQALYNVRPVVGHPETQIACRELIQIEFVRLRGFLPTSDINSVVADPYFLVRRGSRETDNRSHESCITLEVNGVAGTSTLREAPAGDLMQEVLRTLDAGSSLRMRVTSVQKDRLRVFLECVGTGSSAELARQYARNAAASVRQALDFRRHGYRVVSAEFEPVSISWPVSYRIVPSGTTLFSDPRKRLMGVDREICDRGVRLASEEDPTTRASIPVDLIAGLANPVEVEWHVSPFSLPKTALDLLDRVLEKLRRAPVTACSESRYDSATLLSGSLNGALEAELQGWRRKRKGVRCSVALRSTQALSPSLIEEVGIATWRGRRFTYLQERSSNEFDATVLDLATCYAVDAGSPFKLPSRAALKEAGIPTCWPPPPRRLPTEGTLLGLSEKKEIRLGQRDRQRHLYIVGGTGTGKSTLLRNLIVQDLVAGAGIFVMDPHGALVDDVLNSIPEKRQDDVVLMDGGDDEYPFCINPLSLDHGNPDVAAGFAANEMLLIIKHLYKENPEGFGPVFEQHYRLALIALMTSAAITKPTPLDVIRFYGDAKFRKDILSGCNDEQIRLQLNSLRAPSGDISWENVTPYITSKFNRLTLDKRVRNLTCQPDSTVDFKEVLNRPHITLVKLPKGTIDAVNVHMLGMMILSKLFTSAMAPSENSADDRPTTNVYIDEFHCFATPTLSQVMAEGRKYGLNMTLANQNLAQVDNMLRDSILGNAANLIAFRTGPVDAHMLRQYFEPLLSPYDLQSLPDFHAAARILFEGVPLLPPFVLETTPPVKPTHKCASVQSIIRGSRSKYCLNLSKDDDSFWQQTALPLN